MNPGSPVIIHHSALIIMLKSLVIDVLVLGGLGLIAVGAWQAWPPLCYIVVGVTLFVGGVVLEVMKARGHYR